MTYSTSSEALGGCAATLRLIRAPTDASSIADETPAVGASQVKNVAYNAFLHFTTYRRAISPQPHEGGAAADEG